MECLIALTQGWTARVDPWWYPRLRGSLNFSQFVESRRWWPWAREGREAAYVFAGDAPCTGEEIGRASARFYALQTVIN